MRHLVVLLLVVFFFSSCNNKNEKFPVFSSITLDGIVLDNSAIQNKVAVVNLWGTWCGPCIGEIPELNKLAEKFTDNDNVIFIAISEENSYVVENFLKRKPFNYLHLTGDEKLYAALHPNLIKTIPRNIVVDKNGVIMYSETGPHENLIEVLSNLIEELI